MKNTLFHRFLFFLTMGEVFFIYLPIYADDFDASLQKEAEVRFETTVAEIIKSASSIESDGPHRPLPLVSSWEYGARDRMGPGNWNFNPSPNVFNEGWFSPGFQMRLIHEGVPLLPVLDFSTGGEEIWKEKEAYYKPALNAFKKNNLPFSIVSSQWEAVLARDKKYMELPLDEQPRVVTPQGEILDRLDPFAPTKYWYEVGKSLTDTYFFAKMQDIYPSPPRIIFVSNNEQPLLRWPDIEQSVRYLKLYGKDRFDDFKRQVIAEAWKEKYRALQKGMRDGLHSLDWKKNAIFIGYSSAAPPTNMGMGATWARYSIHSSKDIVPQAQMWDGGSPSYYLHAFRSITDYTLDSPQIESMNLAAWMPAVYSANPRYWMELSVWDGDTPPGSKTPSKIQRFIDSGQTWDENRYRGFIQYGLWLVRPRVLREYRVEYRQQDLSRMESYFRSMASSVEQLYHSDILKEFWEKGKLVSNPNGNHPFQENLPSEVRNWKRWFLLDVDINPKPPLKSTTVIPVFSLALELGNKPNRKWLVYAHSPLGSHTNVKITIPDYKTVAMDTSPAGNFIVVDEASQSVDIIHDFN